MSLVLRAAALAGVLFALPADAAVLVTVDKSAQQMTVAVDGRPLYQWPVSTGAPGYDTPGGKFKAFRMERDHFSKEFDDAPMPFSIFFTERGHAIHGSYDKRIGRPVSHGCVRLSPENAKTLYTLVEQEGVLNTTVVLTGTIPTGVPQVARRAAPRRYDQTQQAYRQPQYYYRGPDGYYYAQPPSGYTYAQPQPDYYAQPQPYYAAPRGYIYRDPYGEPAYRYRGSVYD
jgi:hypothetical protein